MIFDSNVLLNSIFLFGLLKHVGNILRIEAEIINTNKRKLTILMDN